MTMGNWNPKSDDFTPLGYGLGSIFRFVGLLMGKKFYMLGLWAWVVPIVQNPINPLPLEVLNLFVMLFSLVLYTINYELVAHSIVM